MSRRLAYRMLQVSQWPTVHYFFVHSKPYPQLISLIVAKHVLSRDSLRPLKPFIHGSR